MDDLIKTLYSYCLERLPYSQDKYWDQMEADEAWMCENFSNEQKRVFFHYKDAINQYHDQMEFNYFKMGLKCGIDLFRSIF